MKLWVLTPMLILTDDLELHTNCDRWNVLGAGLTDQQHSSGPGPSSDTQGCAAANSEWPMCRVPVPAFLTSGQWPAARDLPGGRDQRPVSGARSYSSAVADDKPAVTSQLDSDRGLLSLLYSLPMFQNLQQTCITCWASPKMYFSTSLCSISFFCHWTLDSSLSSLFIFHSTS